MQQQKGIQEKNIADPQNQEEILTPLYNYSYKTIKN